MWGPVGAALSATHRVIAPDLRGFGDTPLPGRRYADAADVVHLLDTLGVDQATFVGASFGGRVALELAAQHPQRVRSLALLCPAYRGLEVGDPVIIEFSEREDALLEAGDIDAAVDLNLDTWVGPEASEQARADLARMQRRAFEVQLAADALDPQPQPERVDVDASAIFVPTLIVSGAHDTAHFREIAGVLGREIESSVLVELPWAGHLPAIERPDETAALLAEYLAHGSVRPIV